MRKELPSITPADIERLLVHRKSLLALGGLFLHHRDRGKREIEGANPMPWPEYPEAVAAFFSAAAKGPWCDYNYTPREAGVLIRNLRPYSTASLDEVRTMLTWCTRGERFCDGHWAAVLNDGTVFALLDRLEALLYFRVEGATSSSR